MEFPDQPFTSVYVIYGVDVTADSERFITRMSPAEHMPAGHNGEAKTERERIASLFTQTEGNDQYDYGYLGEESGNPQFYPAGYTDSEGLSEPADDTPEDEIGCGYHRKWVGELTRDEWLTFADSYLIDLDDAGYPERYEETMGSITEHGHLEAVSVDNREGWGDSSGDDVIDSSFYVSFAYASDPA